MDSVRLACVKHAASVRPEPGSNSPSRTSCFSQIRETRTATEQVEFWKVRVGIVSLSAYPHQRFLTNQ
jgi:hypothetical protein